MESLAHFLSHDRLEELLAKFPALKVGVVGDVALDAYWYADMTRSRLSRETPHYPRPVVKATYGPGAGANTAQDLKALGVGSVSLFSVVGRDLWAAQLGQELVDRGVQARWIQSANRRTHAYIKPILMGYHSQQEDARLDFENAAALSEEEETLLLEALRANLPHLDALVVADQMEMHGVLTERVLACLNEWAGAQPQTLFLVDSRTRIGAFRGMVLKPNELEAAAAAGLGPVQPLDFAEIGRRLSQASGRPVFVTAGEQGAWACQPDRQELIPAAPARPPLDIVGAGDAFMAALAAGLAAGASPWEAGALANLAAAVTVEKINQTGTASPEEIRERYRTMDQQ